METTVELIIADINLKNFPMQQTWVIRVLQGLIQPLARAIMASSTDFDIYLFFLTPEVILLCHFCVRKNKQTGFALCP